MRDGGKGDIRRPLVISEEQFNNNWDLIFGRKNVTTGNVSASEGSAEPVSGGETISQGVQGADGGSGHSK